ncbi:hypothetical protein K431DRAFT_318933 [Polychaeton citri CBS 116435]|uniref:Integral membrane protein n=1 Tax=Polychaeton citri CBS 116435 TaxID=1314669 RepID=A0A9P4QBM2_9PEZI|nr:hypothetical protein K431DRAFT_318933 [Polychaeton citri CBS 116435]
MQPKRSLLTTSAALLLVALPVAIAHGDEHMDMGNMDMGAAATSPVEADSPQTYFRHPYYAKWMLAHITLMVAAWVFALPAAIMLSIAKSRYSLPAQLGFHLVNGLGMFTGFVYNHSTPDLYVNNSHHPIGWVSTSFTIAWTLMALFNAYTAHLASRSSEIPQTHPVTAAAMEQYQQQYTDEEQYRWSRDSGHGTERNSESLFSPSRSNSSSSIMRKPEAPGYDADDRADYSSDEDSERQHFLGNNRVDRFISRHASKFGSARSHNVVAAIYAILEKLLLLLGFLSVTTGFVVYGGVFQKREVFSGLAHFIKGGIFFWYGLLTLGRWMGAFSKFGWAWNVRPQYPLVSRSTAWVPSAEFVESFVIFVYGCSNVFLEHLNAWGKPWSAQDFEHVSITLLFFGGGLLGMLIESSGIRNMHNTTVELVKSQDQQGAEAPHFQPRGAVAAKESELAWDEPNTYKVPLNPVPGLVIMLLGIMMSSHHQHSMVATMIHAQWGTLFVGFAMARAVTYITLFLKPPTSHFPARPPSEIIAAFCLTSGGLLFMGSARDTVSSLEANGLDAMIAFTVTMGTTGVLLAYELFVFALKGWAVRKERALA